MSLYFSKKKCEKERQVAKLQTATPKSLILTCQDQLERSGVEDHISPGTQGIIKRHDLHYDDSYMEAPRNTCYQLPEASMPRPINITLDLEIPRRKKRKKGDRPLPHAHWMANTTSRIFYGRAYKRDRHRTLLARNSTAKRVPSVAH